MEQDLNEFIESDSNLNYYKPEHRNQDVSNNKKFQKWKENAQKYIDNHNKREHNRTTLTISFCNNCGNYVICSFKSEYSYIKCKNCKSVFCAGCHRKIYEKENRNYSLCLKGYIKLLFIRAFKTKTEIFPIFENKLIQILICLF